MPYNVIVSALDFSGTNGDAVIYVIFDSTGNYVDYNFLLVVPTPTLVYSDIKPLVAANMVSFFSTKSYGSIGNVVWDASFASTNSYQTIVSQTGTAAPAVSGSMVPVNTYNSGVTFAWARTSAGIYTLTASSAVFNTAGKTAVIIGPLNNLNGAFTAVVTSTTVITITTAIQSLAVLGLLGFTATPTDALLSKTMIEVRTYP